MVATKSDFRPVYSVVNPENTLVIIGSALNGPSKMPFQISSEKPITDILGESPLADAYIAAVAAGTPNIVLYRMNGVYSEAIVKCITPTISKDVLLLRSVSASDEYNDIQMKVFSTHLFFPATSYRPEKSYFFDSYKTIQELVYDINKDAHYGVIEFVASAIEPNFDLSEFSDLVGDIIVDFSGGETQDEFVTKRSTEVSVEAIAAIENELKKDLFGEDPQDQIEYIPNSMLGMLDFGAILLADMFHDDIKGYDEQGNPIYAEYSKLLGNFCLHKQIETGNGCIGITGTKPLIGEEVSIKTQTLIGLSSLVEEEWKKYVQVIAGDNFVFGSNRVMPSAYSYASTQVRNPYYIMMSNKSLEGIRNLVYEFSKEDVDSLSANGYTCIVASIRRGFVPYVAVSYSRDTTSLLSKPHCVRIANYVSKTLTNKLDSFIGGMSNPITRQEVMDRVHEILGGLVNNKVIMEYKANGKFLNGNRDIDLQIDIRPFSEVRSVSSIVTLSVPGGVIR